MLILVEKLEVEADVVKGTVEGLANLLLEGCKYKVIVCFVSFTSLARWRDRCYSVIPNDCETVRLIFCTFQLSGEVFRDSIIALGFTKEKEAILCKLYGAEESKISEALSSVGLKLPRYHDMEWRFEVQVFDLRNVQRYVRGSS